MEQTCTPPPACSIVQTAPPVAPSQHALGGHTSTQSTRAEAQSLLHPPHLGHAQDTLPGSPTPQTRVQESRIQPHTANARTRSSASTSSEDSTKLSSSHSTQAKPTSFPRIPVRDNLLLCLLMPPKIGTLTLTKRCLSTSGGSPA